MKKTIVQLLVLLLPAMGFAQQYSINWYKIAGGGGTSTNSQYSLSGTIGQPDASMAMSGGNYSITGGFWSIIAVIPTPGAPTIYINQSGGTVTVSWQAVAGWNLYQNSNLSTTSWSTSGGVSTANGTNYLSLSHPSGNLFFRLHNP
jgi:hypothetical protein